MAEQLDAKVESISDEQFLATLNIASIVLFFVFILGYVVYHLHRENKNKIKKKRKIEDVKEKLARKFAPLDGVTVYGHPISPAHRRVVAMLEELNLVYRVVNVEINGEQKSEEYMKISPNGKVPCVLFQNSPQFFTGSRAPNYLFESNVITEFLDRKIHQTEADRLYPPSGSLERLQVYSWQHWDWEVSQYLRVFARQNAQSVFSQLLNGSKKNYPDHQQTDTQGAVNQSTFAFEELELFAITAYRLIQLVENALEGKQYLVADRFTVADLSVYPRLYLFPCFGLPLPYNRFPNVRNYMKRIGNRRCMKRSSNAMLLTSHCLFGNPWIRNVVLAAARLRSGLATRWFDGAKVINRALADYGDVMSCLEPEKDFSGQTILYDYVHHPDSWALKLLLMYKVSSSLENLPAETFRECWQEVGKTMRMEELDSVDLIGRQNGSCLTQRVQLNTGDVITGSTAIFHHFASIANNDLANMQLVSDRETTDLKEGAPEVQCWLAWCQALYSDVMYLLMENYIFSHYLHKKYIEDEILAFRSKPFYSTTYLDIIRVYSQRLDPSSDAFQQLRESYPFLKLGATSDHLITEHIGALHKQLQYIDSKLEKNTYLAGESPTLADIVVFCHMLFMPYLSMKISTRKYPNLCQWITDLKLIPVFHAIDKQLQSTMSALNS